MQIWSNQKWRRFFPLGIINVKEPEILWVSEAEEECKWILTRSFVLQCNLKFRKNNNNHQGNRDAYNEQIKNSDFWVYTYNANVYSTYICFEIFIKKKIIQINFVKTSECVFFIKGHSPLEGRKKGFFKHFLLEKE